MFKKLLLSLMVLAVFLLHQDFWNWNRTEPLMFGFLPFGLAYHAAYAVLAAIMMALLVKFAWPADLDRIESKLDDENKTPKP
ncbi:MAG TPA: DUF3311 domain-containing protein [Verrucomicrobiae bacterium]|nr:DUF3311 domain-containing protein [Verrucomicrobiae bacterium]